MLKPYRELLRIPGAWQFTTAGFFARTPVAMLPLAVILFVSARSGSFAIAGALVAAYQIPNSTVTIYTSRLTDRYGQPRVTTALVLVYTAALCAFMGAVVAGLNWWLVGTIIAIAGASNPAIGSVVRARWAHAVEPSRVGTAFAMESTLDELNWTLAPMLTAILATTVAPIAPMFLAAALTLIAGLAFSLQRRTAPPAHGRDVHHSSRGMLRHGLIYVVIIAAGIGVLFGAYEIAVVAFCEQREAYSASGIVLALWALGSMIGGLWFGTRAHRRPLGSMLAIQLTLLVVLLIPTLLAGSVLMLSIVALISSFAVAPALITGFSLAERLVPATSVTEGLTWAVSGITLGFAAGSAIAGKLIDATGVASGFWLALVGTLIAMVLAWSVRTRLDRNARTDDLTPAGQVPAISPIDEPVPGPVEPTYR